MSIKSRMIDQDSAYQSTPNLRKLSTIPHCRLPLFRQNPWRPAGVYTSYTDVSLNQVVESTQRDQVLPFLVKDLLRVSRAPAQQLYSRRAPSKLRFPYVIQTLTKLFSQDAARRDQRRRSMQNMDMSFVKSSSISQTQYT